MSNITTTPSKPWLKTAITDKEVFLHVGLHKAASTSLQYNVFPHFDANEVFYNLGDTRAFIDLGRMWARTGTKGYGNNGTEVWYQRVSSKLSEATQPKIFLSSEALSGHPGLNHIHRDPLGGYLRNWFPNAHIILVFRNQVDWLPSVYRETLRAGGTHEPLNRFLNFRRSTFFPAEDRLSHNVNALAFDWFEYVKSYERLFGHDRVHVFFMEHFALEPRDFIERLEAIMGVALNYENVGHQRRNLGLSALSIVLLQKLLSSSLSDANKDRFKRQIVARLGHRKNLDWDILGEHKRTLLREHYREINKRLEPYFPNDEVRRYYL